MNINYERLEFSTEYVLLCMHMLMHRSPSGSELSQAANKVIHSLVEMNDLMIDLGIISDPNLSSSDEDELEMALGQSVTQ